LRRFVDGEERNEDGSLDVGVFGAAGGYVGNMDFSFIDGLGRSLRLAGGDERDRSAKPQLQP
jgi:hypothetical protein